MQRLQGSENTLPGTSLYDSEAVRKVLARASEIESAKEGAAQSEMLSPSQIEALGEEIGLSPDAIRRALGEIGRESTNGVTASPRIHPRSAVTATPLTQEQVKKAALTTLYYSLLCSPVVLLLSHLMYSNTITRALGATLAIIMAVVIPILLAWRSGYLIRRAGIGAIFGGLTTFFVFLMAVIGESIVGPRFGMGFQPVLYFLITLSGMIAGATGAVVRNWWESLPKNSDR